MRENHQHETKIILGTDFWDELSPQQKAEIEKASLEIENGEITDFETFMQKHR
jgi:TRAP-type C4-dicarboxylate transport system substrate-binding protein